MSHLYSFDIDGCAFDVSSDESQAGVAHYSWVNGPTPGYGFTEGSYSGQLPTRAGAESSIRSLLKAIDPATGHL